MAVPIAPLELCRGAESAVAVKLPLKLRNERLNNPEPPRSVFRRLPAPTPLPLWRGDWGADPLREPLPPVPAPLTTSKWPSDATCWTPLREKCRSTAE